MGNGRGWGADTAWEEEERENTPSMVLCGWSSAPARPVSFVCICPKVVEISQWLVKASPSFVMTSQILAELD